MSVQNFACQPSLCSGHASAARIPENYFDLEDPTDLNRLVDAKLGLGGLSGLVVIDDPICSRSFGP